MSLLRGNQVAACADSKYVSHKYSEKMLNLKNGF